jgi:hypothetical protein
MPDTIKLNLDEMIQRFKFLGEHLAPTVYSAMLITAQNMLRDVVSKRMSNPRRGSTATNLGVDTGTARRSMIDQAGLEAERVFALIGSPVDYVKAHEEGFHGTVNVPGHVRRNVSLKRNVKTGLVSKTSARQYKAALKAGHKTTSFVRAHKMKLDIMAKHFIRDTVQEAVAPLEKRVLQALMIATKTGSVPSPGQLGA